MAGSLTLARSQSRRSLYSRYLKRLFDLVAAGAAIVVLSPLFLLVGVLIRLEDGGRAIFRQSRIGRDGQRFMLFKFRSMPENTAHVPSVSASALRITRVGYFLRRTNVDELPQLINILRGDMSVVGPRPALPVQDKLIALRRENGALRCTPGLTGLAQVRAYSGMAEEEKARHDAEYASDITLLGDLGIIVRTVGYLLRPPPVY
jgi:lipopolysaccharide/colanic/teichoic acid biosynthesis glycosyltransferase